MVAHIKTLKEDNGDIVYPVTTPEAVNYGGSSGDVIKGDGTASKVTASNIDFTTLKDQPTNMPYVSTSVTMMYGTTAYLRRCGNLVTVFLGGRFNTSAPQSTTSSETIPVGYRPRHNVRACGFIGGKIATMELQNNGKIFYWTTSSVSNNDEVNALFVGFTTDAWPS